MLQGLILKKVIDAVLNAIMKKHNLKKMQDYVEKPNELDKQMKQVQKSIGKYGKYIEGLEKNVAILKKESHPPIYSNKDKNKIDKRLHKLEKRSKI